MQVDICSKLEEAPLRLFFFLPEQDKWEDNPKTWCCRPLLSLTQTQRVGAHTHTHTETDTHTPSAADSVQQGCHTGSRRKSGDDLQLWSPVARRAGLRAWPRFLPRTASERGAATEQMMPLGAENKRLLPTHRAAHALLAAH